MYNILLLFKGSVTVTTNPWEKSEHREGENPTQPLGWHRQTHGGAGNDSCHTTVLSAMSHPANTKLLFHSQLQPVRPFPALRDRFGPCWRWLPGRSCSSSLLEHPGTRPCAESAPGAAKHTPITAHPVTHTAALLHFQGVDFCPDLLYQFRFTSVII